MGRCEAEDCCFLLWSLWVSQVVLVVKTPPASAGDARVVGLIPGLGQSPGVGNGNPLQYSCLKNSIDRGAWWATVHGVTKSWTRLSTCACIHTHVTSDGLKPYTHINLIKHTFLERKRGECLVYFCAEMLEGTLASRGRATTEGRKGQGIVMILRDINIRMSHWCKKDFWRLLKQEEIGKV